MPLDAGDDEDEDDDDVEGEEGEEEEQREEAFRSSSSPPPLEKLSRTLTLPPSSRSFSCRFMRKRCELGVSWGKWMRRDGILFFSFYFSLPVGGFCLISLSFSYLEGAGGEGGSLVLVDGVRGGRALIFG